MGEFSRRDEAEHLTETSKAKQRADLLALATSMSSISASSSSESSAPRAPRRFLPKRIVAFAAASYGYYILPTYPSDLAAIQFDRSGTTHIGKYVINHSFILPGLIGVSTSCVVGYLLASLTGLI